MSTTERKPEKYLELAFKSAHVSGTLQTIHIEHMSCDSFLC